ncbi:hypothetical protein BDA99DRAFT_66447 [Phascolomyces articulosus]|uniref:RING-type domain-containing protein n=1 Tax=Phascolomyces articulosus TaxID=60185 RepID=A0AAD5K0J3_9FUNG|nr:hypothetical protein BDA99DRAFT_66447 [Phascolomyces articulosus]
MFSLDASAAGSLLFSPSVSREGSANTLNATITGEPSVTSSTTSSGWRRFSSSIARFWGGSDSTSRGQEDEQQQQQTNDQQQPFECFQDCLEGPLLSTTSATTPATNAAAPVIGSSSSSSSAMARHSSMNNMNTPAATTPTSLVVEEDAAEEATIPNNDAPSNTQPTGMGREDEDEDPEALLCPICRDVLNSVAVTACGHTFCYPCISQYVASSPDCPICRSRLTQQQILPNYQCILFERKKGVG